LSILDCGSRIANARGSARTLAKSLKDLFSQKRNVF